MVLMFIHIITGMLGGLFRCRAFDPWPWKHQQSTVGWSKVCSGNPKAKSIEVIIRSIYDYSIYIYIYIYIITTIIIVFAIVFSFCWLPGLSKHQEQDFSWDSCELTHGLEFPRPARRGDFAVLEHWSHGCKCPV